MNKLGGTSKRPLAEGSNNECHLEAPHTKLQYGNASIENGVIAA
jgi:hypothetical protein